MQKLIYSFLFFTIFQQILLSQSIEPFGGGEYVINKSQQCIPHSERETIKKSIKENFELLKKQNKIVVNKNSIIKFDWPIRSKASLSFNSYYGTTNYVDHNPIATGTQYGSSNLDYFCGNRTYDTNSGYNHAGIDIASWPFPWYLYENDLIEIVAAESGVIIGKTDGNKDDNCSCQGNANSVNVMHSDGSVSWYIHLKSNSLTNKQVGESVMRGEYLGIMASSGCSTGPHLHFEVYDNNNQLIDPYIGNCNSLNNETWWENQKPYKEPNINALLTHDAPPVLDCPLQNEIPNFSNDFQPGDQVYTAAYYRDQIGTETTFYKIRRPDNSIWQSWEHSSGGDYVTSWWYWTWNLPTSTENCGNWKFEATFNGQTYSHDFFVSGQLTNWYADNDGDGFGNPQNSQQNCNQPSGYVANDNDCDDNNSNVNPDAQEVCNGIDDDCNGLTDSADPNVSDNATWYADNDGDGFGNPQNSQQSCSQPSGFVSNSNDCDDNNSNVNPDAQEVCNGIDDDCNGLTDNDDPNVSGNGTWYADNDGDGFGNPQISQQNCSQPSGFVSNSDDCDDSNSNVNPDAQEVCNGIDDDCNGLTDDDDPNVSSTIIWYIDNDGDGFGNPNPTLTIPACTEPLGFVNNSNDCDDSNPNINPDALEIENNGIDEDCDGMDLITTSTADISTLEIKIYPNPSNDIINIEVDRILNYKVELLDLRGKILHRSSNSNEINVRNLNKGIYLIIIKDSSTSQSLRSERVAVIR